MMNNNEISGCDYYFYDLSIGMRLQYEKRPDDKWYPFAKDDDPISAYHIDQLREFKEGFDSADSVLFAYVNFLSHFKKLNKFDRMCLIMRDQAGPSELLELFDKHKMDITNHFYECLPVNNEELSKGYKQSLNFIGPMFHQGFRRTDVTSSSVDDMRIHSLITREHEAINESKSGYINALQCVCSAIDKNSENTTEKTIEPDYTSLTSEQSAQLPIETRQKLLKEAKGGTWYDGWRPYCTQCSTMARMAEHAYGFECTCCLNKIGWNLVRLIDSPLNK